MRASQLWFMTSAFVLVSTTAAAHTLHLDSNQSPAAIVLAHDGKLEPIAGVRIVSVTAVSFNGQASNLDVARSDTKAAVTIPATARAALVRYSGINAGRAPDGSRRVGSRMTNPDVAEVGRSEIETLAILGSGARMEALPTSPLRLEPVGSVFDQRAGGFIRVRALLNGQPLPNATIRLQAAASEDGGAIATTGPDGVARVTIPYAGMNLFAISFVDRTANDPDAHVIRRQASLSFVARPARTR